MPQENLASELVGRLRPQALPVSVGQLQVFWVARTVAILPEQGAVASIALQIEERVMTVIESTYHTIATDDWRQAVRPKLLVTRLDDFHLAVSIVFAGKGIKRADEDVISEWGTLTELDRLFPFSDLQGLPWNCWFQLRRSRSEQS